MTNEERRKQGLPYIDDTPEWVAVQIKCQDKMMEYNNTMPSEVEKRQQLLKEVFAEAEECHVETPVHSPWGCSRVHLGKYVYVNCNVTFVDDADIYIGDRTMIGPNVVFSTAGHPILPVLREHGYSYSLPIHVGSNVWIGSGVQILPGLTIGDNSVIGAGSVVTSDIPANVVAYGVPCHVAREIGERDREFYYKNRRLDVWE